MIYILIYKYFGGEYMYNFTNYKKERKLFISIKKYQHLSFKCPNCRVGKVTGGVKRNEAKRVSNCCYCNGSGNKTHKQIPIGILVD